MKEDGREYKLSKVDEIELKLRKVDLVDESGWKWT